MLVSEFKTKIRAWLGNRPATAIEDSILGDLIDMTIRDVFLSCDSRYGELRLGVLMGANSNAVFFDVYTDSNLGGKVGVGAAVSKVIRLSYVGTDGVTAVPLRQLSFDGFIASYPGFGTVDDPIGDPQHWTMWNNSTDAPVLGVYVLPRPAIEISIGALLYYLPGHFLDADSPPILFEQEELVLFGVLSKAAKYLIEDARGPVWEEEYEKRLMSFQIQESNRNLNGRPLSAAAPG